MLLQELEAALAAQQLASRQAARRVATDTQAVRAQLAVLSKPQPTAAAPAPLAALPPAAAAAPAPAAAPQPPPITMQQVPALPRLPAVVPAHSIALSAAAAASAAAKAAAASAVPIAAPALPPVQQQLTPGPVASMAFEGDAAIAPPSAPPPAVAPFFRMPLPRLPDFASPAATPTLPPATAPLAPVVPHGGAVLGASPLMQQHLATLAALQAQVRGAEMQLSNQQSPTQRAEYLHIWIRG